MPRASTTRALVTLAMTCALPTLSCRAGMLVSGQDGWVTGAGDGGTQNPADGDRDLFPLDARIQHDAAARSQDHVVQMDASPKRDHDTGKDLPWLLDASKDKPPKPDAPKPDAPKPDAPKPDAPKPDAPKPDGPKPDAPKLIDAGTDTTVDMGGSKDSAAPPDTTPLPDAVVYQGAFPQGSGYLTAILTVAGLTRTIRIYRPVSALAAPSLLILFHGTNDDATYMIASSFAKSLADAQGVVVVSPQARKMTTGDWDNHLPGDVYWETYPATSPATNPDLLLVQAIIQEAASAYGADTKRVYTLGHSNGGFFSILAAMALPGKIAAFAANSSGLVRCTQTASCTFTGSATTCAGLSGQAGYCSCSGAEKPVSVKTSGRRPPGYLTHSNDDSAVSVYYTCALWARMAALAYTSMVTIYSGNGHSMPNNLAVNSWPFLSAHTLP